MKNRSGWIKWVVIAAVAAQLYIVQELAAALLLFSVVFAAFALLVGMVRLNPFAVDARRVVQGRPEYRDRDICPGAGDLKRLHAVVLILLSVR